MEVKRCAYCGKKLSSRRRADARYCPTSRCRVGGYRERVLKGTYSTAVHAPYETHNLRGKRVIQNWIDDGYNIVQDPWCQARAEKLAYELMKRQCEERAREAYDREFAAWSPWGSKETTVGPWRRIRLTEDVRCVGLAIIPSECGGGAVLVTGTEQDSRYRRR